MREYAFELRLCAHLEADGVPGVGEAGVVARQLGTSVHATGGRIVDAVCVLPGPAFDARMALTSDTIPRAVLDAPVPVGTYERVTRVFDGPPERARAVADAGAETGFLDVARRDGQQVVRQPTRYPEWIGGLVGVENKPDLERPGGLSRQLRHDASLGVLDYAVVATESHVTGAHLNRLPDAVGVWRVDFDRERPIRIVREPERLDAAGPGLEVLDEHAARTDVRPVSGAAKARQRRQIAERAHGKGWRTFDLPACARASTGDGGVTLPYCEHFDRVVDPARECGTDCPGFADADPPAVDLDAERERRTRWERDAGGRHRQAGLDQF
ncbi:DUF5787 family protein [Halobacterium salinarum]|uniref:DUF5787 family protein n=1 Tax=Halobacterium salinarum TaxID=2242 RepID=UPI001F406600|nr:DUF5787 family protein [Halobacterium salinarum]MCF2165831.1 hypothetical protein [Halobacterium salinarum]MCF2167400.1 hypothetical protein [Halobacterium salinarum]